MNLILLLDDDFTDASRTTVRLSGRRRDHLLSVCRVKPGDDLRVGLVNGRMGTGRVLQTTGDAILLSVDLCDQPPPPLPLTLVLAMPRPKALKRCVETVAAMGVKKIFIIESWRVEKSYWSSPFLSETALREHLLLGLEQGCDTALPRIEIRKRFKPFVEDELPELVRGTTAIVAHPCAEKRCPYMVSGPITLAIGPEGGFIPYEIALLEKQGFEPVSMGKRILRVEQAVPALIGRLL
ncbi:MAG: 16S rRNA (uracil(1498)-N(3))-methyltransferase [Chitinispirillaceae bacterium]|nr:16S rRNA (uracil(1498)-N(3))-methyltransferase [Chitinispirillaceae bacterium]